MAQTINELLFDFTLVAAAGVAFITHMLGLLFEPMLGIVAGIVLLGVGLLTVVPQEKLVIAGTVGLFSVLLAGTVAPRFVTQFTDVTDEMSLSLLLSGLILLLTVALFHVTVFTRPDTPTA